MEENIVKDNESLIDAQYKDSSPTETVRKIKEILHSHNISTTEIWSESGVEYCYSLRVNVNGTKFGTNGKGLTREFALASAYGELMERLQLGLFGDSSVQKLGYFNYAVGEEELFSVDMLYDEIPAWYDYLAEKISVLDKESISGKDILSRFATDGKTVEAVKFYNLMTGKDVLVSKNLRCIVCGSNGGAAGNSMEEAVVQAISEIIERHYKLEILSKKLSLPEIPESVLQKYQTAYKIIKSVREKGYRVIVKDCSLGKAFPVVCVIYVNEKTGKYHTHFGAYPILEIALERTLTESFQGRNVDSFAKNDSFLFSSSDVFSYKNVYNDLKKGDYLKTPEFFVGEHSYSYNEKVGFTGKTNAELLPQIIEFFDKQGYEILVRDVSSLGFPTYNVFIPKYSEVLYQSLSKKHFSNFASSSRAIKALRDLNSADFEELLFIMMHIDEIKKLSSLKKTLFNFANCANLVLNCSQEEDSYLLAASLAYIYYTMGNLSQSLSFLEKMLSSAKETDIEFLLCLKKYLTMRLNNYDEKASRSLVDFFHRKETASNLYRYIDNGLNPFDKFVLKCAEADCEQCMAHSYCYQKNTTSLASLIKDSAAKLNYDAFTDAIKKYSLNQSI